MKDTLKAIFYSISAIAFIIFIAVFYLSEENKRHTYKIRTQYLEKVNNYLRSKEDPDYVPADEWASDSDPNLS